MSLKELEVSEESTASATLTAVGKKRDGSTAATMYSPIFTWDTLPAAVIVKNVATGFEISSGNTLADGVTSAITFEIPAMFDVSLGTTYNVYFKCKRSSTGSFLADQTATLKFVNNEGLWSVEVSWN